MTALRFCRLYSLAQTSASITLGLLGFAHWALSLACAAASFAMYVEASERLRVWQ